MQSEVNNGIFVAAHEMKAPLVLLRQMALVLDPNDPREVSEYQERMVSVSERALKQVSDLAKVARLEDGLFEMEPVAVRGVVDEVNAELKYLFRFNARKLEIKYSNRSRLVTANRELLHSVIYNFCVNALKYSSEETATRLSVRDSRGKVMISVRDFGPSLPKKVYDKIATGTLEAPTGISFRPDSSGLGLYIAVRFAKYMHAEVGAVRHKDGTSFFVAVPVSRQGMLFE